jgi:predicted nucleic acid-binding protein
MNHVFADTGYWIAYLDPQDILHMKAVALSEIIPHRYAKTVTSEWVLIEVLNHFAGFGAAFRDKAVTAVRALMSATTVDVVTCDFAAALTLYERRRDKEWGLVDCSSIVIMQSHGITDVLAHDTHLRQAGFQALLRDS